MLTLYMIMLAPLINGEMVDCLAESIGRKSAYQLKKKNNRILTLYYTERGSGWVWEVTVIRNGQWELEL